MSKSNVDGFNLTETIESGLRICIPASAHETLRFAADELKTNLSLVGRADCSITEGEMEAGGNSIVLRLTHPQGNDGDSENLDEFEIRAEYGNAVIAGASPRAVLFGTYRFLEEHAGISWPTPAYRHIPATPVNVPIIGRTTRKATFARRGLVLESSETTEYAMNLIDWSAKNGLNDLFFTFDLWERYQDELRPELAKRQLMLTLGGHNLGMFFPSGEHFAEHPEWFALPVEGGRRIADQPCYSNEAGVAVMVDNVVRYVEREIRRGTVLATLSLWPNDNKHVCNCPACREAGFISTYIGFLSRLRRSFASKGISVNVEHIAYNAQLEWSMLEEVPASSELDTLIACWGRDYKDSIASPNRPRDVRFKEITEKWANACGGFGTNLTVFEYYSDYWMLTSVFPPLLRTIAEDMAYYRSVGANGVMSLILPYSKAVRIIREDIGGQPIIEAIDGREMNSEDVAMWLNLYVFSRLTWQGEDDADRVTYRFCNLFYGERASLCKGMLDRLSIALAGLSAYNTEFFKLRFIDTWLRMKDEEIVNWNPSNDNGSVPRARIAECRRALEVLDNGFANVPLAGGGKEPDEQLRNVTHLLSYYEFIVVKLKSILSQSLGQLDYIENRREDAVSHWQEALRSEDEINGWDREICREWLERAMSHDRE
ncbi:DUF4838 domain-containing protein [Cohnella herbarum]|uniref:DUF4838 domain-containing protein n=1 Tax=Cohnella herbarum TaxID=2728023 RepID=A0A7Z2ZNL4_9BACL|nr:DUF4838 domain-containing protein [Cohnella herbarum]QJD85177.1 DUF4838 domain-containing protein [Cohnella herbarum]